MKSLKISKAIVVGILLTTSYHLYAQTAYDQSAPSVNAKQFFSAATATESLQTGQLSINLPLFNLRAKGVSIPITIAFNAAGITRKSEESPIGLGWSLLAGGVITRTVNGEPDDHTGLKSDYPWIYYANYLQNKYTEELNSPYTNNLFQQAMDENPDKQADEYRYSILGRSGDIVFEHKTSGSGVAEGTLFPDKSFKIEKTTNGYKIIDNQAIEYLFETTESRGNYITGWYLTQINTPQGGEVEFIYATDTYTDQTSPYQQTYSVKRITEIDYGFGKVVFQGFSRKIVTINHYNSDDEFIGGWEFDNDSYFQVGSGEGSPGTWRKLDGVNQIDHNGITLPPYQFEYDHYFSYGKGIKNVTINPNYPDGSWAYNPTPYALVDRSFIGEINPVLVTETFVDPYAGTYYITTPRGISSAVDDQDAYTLLDYFTLTKMTLPTGGSETYYYEAHDYGFYSQQPTIDTVKSDYANRENEISGRRIWKKEITDGNGNTRNIEYEYCLHENDYSRVLYSSSPVSSGKLVNPAFHTSVVYEYATDYSTPRLKATPRHDQIPQNSSTRGAAIYYTEVEEIITDSQSELLGKKIHYFEGMYALPSANYVFLNDNYTWAPNKLVTIPNTLYGNQFYGYEPEISGLNDDYFTYLAYPVGQMYISDLNIGKKLKEVTLDTSGDSVQIIENEYTPGYPVSAIRFGLVVKKFVDNDLPNSQDDWNRYLIAQTIKRYGVKNLIKKTVTNYFDVGQSEEETSFTNNSLNLPYRTSTVTSTGETVLEEVVYPKDINFQTTSGLSTNAASLDAMIDENMVGVPVQTTVKSGDEYIKGSYTTFKELPGGAIVVDTEYQLKADLGNTVSDPYVNSSGNLVINDQFVPGDQYTDYDVHGNPTTRVTKDGRIETLVWGYGGQYPIAKIENYTYSQVLSNSTLLTQLLILDNYTVVTESERSNVQSCNQSIRNSLPSDALVTTYTYDHGAGITSITDFNNKTTYYKYDSFKRLFRITDHDGNVLEDYYYNYQN